MEHRKMILHEPPPKLDIQNLIILHYYHAFTTYEHNFIKITLYYEMNILPTDLILDNFQQQC
jgi:hypothetical protein